MISHDPAPDAEQQPAALARALARSGRLDEAARVVAGLLGESFGLAAEDIRLTVDAYSLNSLSGTFTTAGTPLFFKFHQEENEAAMAGEYYRASLLADAGYPVDRPLHVSSEPGRQILIYRRRDDRRFADVLRELDDAGRPEEAARALAAERELDRSLMAIYRRTLHPIDSAQSAAEPIHRLFHARLIDAGRPDRLGGRFATFFHGQRFAFPGLELDWDVLGRTPFEVNGIAYRQTLGELFEEALWRLAPARFAGSGGVTAHGDAHNANVWYERAGDGARLVMFDPAFAGDHVPAALAEVKTTFHNVFAHPFWLYEPAEAERHFRASAELVDGRLRVATDWRPTPIRLGLLKAKRDLVWGPLLAELAAAGLLPDDWRRIVRLALFLCPTLVMSLRAGAGPHNRVSTLIGLASAVSMGSEPLAGNDAVSRLLDAIDPMRQGGAGPPCRPRRLVD